MRNDRGFRAVPTEQGMSNIVSRPIICLLPAIAVRLSERELTMYCCARLLLAIACCDVLVAAVLQPVGNHCCCAVAGDVIRKSSGCVHSTSHTSFLSCAHHWWCNSWLFCVAIFPDCNTPALSFFMPFPGLAACLLYSRYVVCKKQEL